MNTISHNSTNETSLKLCSAHYHIVCINSSMANIISKINYDKNCSDCVKNYAKLLYVFTTSYDAISDMLIKYEDNLELMFELGRYNLLLYNENLSYMVDVNGFYYPRCKHNYTTAKMISYLTKCAEQNNYDACYLLAKYYLSINNDDEFIKWSTIAYKNNCFKTCYLYEQFNKNRPNSSQQWNLIGCSHNDINSLLSHAKKIYSNISSNSTHPIDEDAAESIFSHMTLYKHAILQVIKLFINNLISLPPVIYENYHKLTEDEKKKVCNIIDSNDPFNNIELFTNITYDKDEIIELNKYYEYMTTSHKIALLHYNIKYAINDNNILNDYVVVSVSELAQYCTDENIPIIQPSQRSSILRKFNSAMKFSIAN